MKKVTSKILNCESILDVVFGVLLVIAAWFAGILALTLCWNYLMPDLFGLPTISLKQAFVLDILAWILFDHSNSKGD